MIKGMKVTGTTIAATAALLFASAPLTPALAATKANQVKCYGVNSCKGQSKCQTATSSCAGLNSCKGKGFIYTKNKEACTKMHGSLKPTDM